MDVQVLERARADVDAVRPDRLRKADR